MTVFITEAQSDLIVELVENFVLDGGPEDDPIYQDAVALVNHLRPPKVAVELTQAELDTVIEALWQEAEADTRERDRPERGEQTARLANRLHLLRAAEAAVAAADQDAHEQASPETRTILCHVNVQMPAERTWTADHIAAWINRALTVNARDSREPFDIDVPLAEEV